MTGTLEQGPPGPRRLEGSILTPDGWMRGVVEFGARIRALTGTAAAGPEPGRPVILPGFIDLHVHGGGGADIMSGRSAVLTAARMHARHGTTSMLATTVCASREDLRRVAAEIGPAVSQGQAGGARVLGLHLEGPFINPGKLGAQPHCTRPGTLEEVLALNALAPIRIVTLAPELDGHLELIKALVDQGIRVQAGHTLGDYPVGVAALQAGLGSFTHLFNAMTGMLHREPGMAAAAMAHAEYAELIADLIHVHPGMILAALRAIPRLYCVTDGTAGSGMPDGPYHLGSQCVTKFHGAVRLADGTLAGSTLTLDQALRNLVGLGLTLEDASHRVSAYAAEYLGLDDRGRIAVGRMADLVVMDPALQLTSVFLEGVSLDLIDA
jgi:N-acetylglucosamine-6-phosphate deacetylase